MTEPEIIALIQRNVDKLKRIRNELLASNKAANYQLYPIETVVEDMRTIKTNIDILESLILQITAGDS